jgi:hypothetical protein
MGEGNESFLHAVKSYDMGPPTLFPIREEGMLLIFIALKNPSPLPGSNPQPLDPVASLLTTTPPRRLMFSYFRCSFISVG